MITLTESDQEYFSRRALQERATAERASDPAIALTHQRLATEYQRRADLLAAAADGAAQ